MNKLLPSSRHKFIFTIETVEVQKAHQDMLKVQNAEAGAILH